QVGLEPPEASPLLVGPALGGALPRRLQGDSSLGRVGGPQRLLGLAQEGGHRLGVAPQPGLVRRPALLVLKPPPQLRLPPRPGLPRPRAPARAPTATPPTSNKATAPARASSSGRRRTNFLSR